MGDRAKLSEEYRIKSKDSYEAARSCLASGNYPSACNRAWYSVMQIITAAIYDELNEQPPNGKPNWPHDRQGNLLRSVLSKRKVFQQHLDLVKEVPQMLLRRNLCDYEAPLTRRLGLDDAKRSIEVAGRVRALLYNLLSDKWKIANDDSVSEVSS